MREPWVLKNLFWILSLTSLVMFLWALDHDKNLGAFVLSVLFFVCVSCGAYYSNLFGVAKRERIDPYDKAHYYQARKKSFKVVNGGKSESLRGRTGGKGS